ncbi:TIGR03084 family metal-binding protein [Streptomyces sp. PTD5-9]|uniref:TIGR03084 family metal-binding protein n=1 Tax=Streptomyces sp. PTD5-9 TaxID=3120150 RepID=UPI00300AE928
MSDVTAVIDDLRDESAELDQLVRELSPEQWSAPTPAPGWSIAHQIAHLTWTDGVALLAATDPDAFAAETAKALEAPDTFVDVAARAIVAEANAAAATAAETSTAGAAGAGAGTAGAVPEVLLARWRDGRERVQRMLRTAPAGTRIPWYGPPMSVATMATARLMETWAHGQDIADALGVTRVPTARLRHVARIGVRARDYAYLVRGIEAPGEEFRVELEAPGGELIAYGPEGAAQRVTGPLLDFCLLVTQRAHRDDLAVRATGPDADRWLDIAQAFAGPPGAGRAPRSETSAAAADAGRAPRSEGPGNGSAPRPDGLVTDAGRAPRPDGPAKSDAGRAPRPQAPGAAPAPREERP